MTEVDVHQRYRESVQRVWTEVEGLSEPEKEAKKRAIHDGIFPGGQELAFNEGWLRAKDYYLAQPCEHLEGP